MIATKLLRTAALVLVIVGIVDPPWTTTVSAPIAIALHDLDRPSAAGNDASGTTGNLESVRRQLSSALADQITFSSETAPAAIVAVGTGVRGADSDRLFEGKVPVSTVSIAEEPAAPNVAIVAAPEPASVPFGWTATFDVSVEGLGMSGRTTRIVLEQQGAVLSHADHVWTRDRERFETRLRYASPTPGSARFTVRAIPLQGEATNADNAVDLRAFADGRRLKVLVQEMRPSWATTFVRRALEEDPTFEVSASATASRGLHVRAGTPPAQLSAESLNAFDAVIVGGPEELSSRDVDALRAFARRRGGTVVLVPDRRPSGRFLDLMPSSPIDELLLERPVEITSSPDVAFRASELAVPPEGLDSSAAEVLASMPTAKGARPVVIAWPLGSGQIVYSGALDAWRFRGTGDGFARFWKARVAEAALTAPPRLAVAVAPGVAAPGEDVAIDVRLRGTEFDSNAARTVLPAVKGRLVGKNFDEAVRLWPTSELGGFTARIEAPVPGDYNIQVTSDGGATGDALLTVSRDARHVPPARQPELMQLVASATGGVAVKANDLNPLEQHLTSLSRPRVAKTIRPAHSTWFIMIFITLLCAEWTLRRRRGLL